MQREKKSANADQEYCITKAAIYITDGYYNVICN